MSSDMQQNTVFTPAAARGNLVGFIPIQEQRRGTMRDRQKKCPKSQKKR